jgi:hypothetical protein
MPSFVSSRPSPELLEQIGKCVTTIEAVAKAFEVYADRPCLAERAYESTEEGIRLLPELRKLRYRDVWTRVDAFASGLAHENPNESGVSAELQSRVTRDPVTAVPCPAHGFEVLSRHRRVPVARTAR